ncbi:uncharacterized protein METZ01_LOCUS307831, partial [marine metagenome]
GRLPAGSSLPSTRTGSSRCSSGPGWQACRPRVSAWPAVTGSRSRACSTSGSTRSRRRSPTGCPRRSVPAPPAV